MHVLSLSETASTVVQECVPKQCISDGVRFLIFETQFMCSIPTCPISK